MQIDGHETTEGFIIRLYDEPISVWVYWPVTYGKVTFYLDTPEEARQLYEALKAIKPEQKG